MTIGSAPIDAALERSPRVRAALETAREAHAGQVRNGSGGRPYIEHPLAVTELLAEHDYGETVLAAALLHDVVEESAVGVEDLRLRFGPDVAALVAALTDPEEIDPYELRKDAHRAAVAAAGDDALAIYAADKLANIRALRRVYADQGEAVGDELKAPLDVKVAVWEADATMLRAAFSDLPFLDELEAELSRLAADRATAAPRPGT
jgi:(p)ppGpp synthase/HD superfamily hydrolase